MTTVKRKGHIFTDTSKKRKSYFFKVSRSDLEQKNSNELVDFINDIKNDLRSLAENEFCKVYKSGFDCIVGSSDSSFELRHHSYSPLIVDDLSLLIGSNDIHSKPVFKDDYVKINATYFRFIRVSETAPFISMFEIESFGDYFLQFKSNPAERAKSKLDNQRKKNSGAFREQLKNITEEAAFEENEALLERITYDEESLYDFELWYVLKDPTLKGLQKKTVNLTKSLARQNFKCLIETSGLKYAFNSYLPGVIPEFKIKSSIHSSCLVNFLPLTEDKLMSEGISLYSRSGRELFFNNFTKESKSFSMIIVGPPGSGKSFFGNKIIDFGMAEGRSSFIIDRGGSYRKTTRYHGGVELKGKFNPLQFKNPEYLQTFLFSKVPDAEVSRLEERKVLEILTETDLSKVNNLESLLDILPDETNKMLSTYLIEIKSYLTDEIRPIHKINYLDLENYPEAVLEPLLVFALEYTNHLEGRIQLLMDEAHEILDKFPRFVEKRFRELRKKDGSPIALTQNFGDFINTKIGKTVAQNAFHKFFFHQECQENEFLDSFDVDRIRSVRGKKGFYSEFYYKSEDHRKVLQYYANSVEYEKYTSNKEDNLKFERFTEEYGEYLNYKELIHKFAEVKEVNYVH